MVTEEEWHGEMAKAKRLRFISPLAGLVVLGLLTVPAVAIGRSFGSGATADAVTAGVLMALLVPLVYVLVTISDRQQRKTDDKVRALTHELSEAIDVADREGVTRELQGQRQRFESRLANALDMAEGEPEVIDVIERSFAAVVPEAPVELLLADNSPRPLLPITPVGPAATPPARVSACFRPPRTGLDHGADGGCDPRHRQARSGGGRLPNSGPDPAGQAGRWM